MDLDDWINKLSAALEVDTEVDQALVLDLARVAAHGVTRPAAPLTTYLLGFAAGARGATAEQVEALAARAERLAEEWEHPAPRAPLPHHVHATTLEDEVIDPEGDAFEDS